jgi:hypothetical protein
MMEVDKHPSSSLAVGGGGLFGHGMICDANSSFTCHALSITFISATIATSFVSLFALLCWLVGVGEGITNQRNSEFRSSIESLLRQWKSVEADQLTWANDRNELIAELTWYYTIPYHIAVLCD